MKLLTCTNRTLDKLCKNLNSVKISLDTQIKTKSISIIWRNSPWKDGKQRKLLKGCQWHPLRQLSSLYQSTGMHLNLLLLSVWLLVPEWPSEHVRVVPFSCFSLPNAFDLLHRLLLTCGRWQQTILEWCLFPHFSCYAFVIISHSQMNGPVYSQQLVSYWFSHKPSAVYTL